MIRIAAFGALLAALLASACRTPQVVHAIVPVQGEEVRIRSMLERAVVEAESRRAMRALASIKLDSESGSGRFREVLVVQRPSSLRLETHNFLGQVQTLLVTDGDTFAFFDGKRIERGRVSPAVLRAHLGLDLEPEEAVGALLAAPALPAAPMGVPREVLGQGDDRIVVFASQRVRFDPVGELAGVDALLPNGTIRWQARYAGWREVEGGRYPYNLVLAFPATSLVAEVSVREVELNPTLDPGLFRIGAGVSE